MSEGWQELNTGENTILKQNIEGMLKDTPATSTYNVFNINIE